MHRRSIPIALAAFVAASPAAAQDADSLRAAFRIAEPPPFEVPAQRVAPGMGANSPSGWGAAWGDVYAGFSFTMNARYVDAKDGALWAGFGLGDAFEMLALEVDIISFSTVRSGFFSRMSMDLKLSRIIADYWGVAVGWESIATRGRSDGRDSRYLAISRWFWLKQTDRAPFNALMLSAGVGDGRFRSAEDWFADRDSWNVFGSVAVRVLPWASVTADWTGQDLALATSIAPFARIPVILSLGAVDLTNNVGDDGGPRFVASGSIGLNFAR